MIQVRVRYWSWFRDLAGRENETLEVPKDTTLGDLLGRIRSIHPELARVERSTLAAVGLDYQPLTQRLREGDEVSLFPPVQGG